MPDTQHDPDDLTSTLPGKKNVKLLSSILVSKFIDEADDAARFLQRRRIMNVHREAWRS